MENTLENKGKLFAQYWGQKVFKYNREGSPIGNEEIGNVLYIPKSKAMDYSFLELKPLSQITDEDSVEVANIFFVDNDYDKEDLITDGKIFTSELLRNQNIGYQRGSHFYIELCDYLRSKGYALPFMGLSVEQLVEYGWVKLTE